MSCSLLLLCGGYLWRTTRRGDGDDKIRGGRFVRSVSQRFSARRFAYWSLDPMPGGTAYGRGGRLTRSVSQRFDRVVHGRRKRRWVEAKQAGDDEKSSRLGKEK